MESKDTALKELLGEKLLCRNGDKIEEITFANWYAKFSPKGQYLCLYFGAHWAPPSRLFTQTLE